MSDIDGEPPTTSQYAASDDAPTPPKHPFLELFQPPEMEQQASSGLASMSYWKGLKALLPTHLKTHLETHRTSKIEDIFIIEMDEMDPNLLDPECVSENGFTALHYAAALGLTTLAEKMLTRGFAKLLYRETRDGKVPIELAMDNEEFATAAVLVRNMKEKSLYLFKRCEDTDNGGGNPPQLLLPTLLKQQWELSQNGSAGETQNEADAITLESIFINMGGKCEPSHNASGNETQDLTSLEEGGSIPAKRHQLNQLVLAVMDTAVERGDKEIENVLGMTESDDAKNPLDTESSCYFFVHKYKIKALEKHKCFQFIAKKKWKEYGLMMQLISFAAYLVFTAILTTALALAAKASNPTVYNDPTDRFRLICEIIAFSYTIWDFVSECHDLRCRTKARNWKRYQSKWKNCLYAVKLHLGWENILDCLAIICTLLIVPFRFADSNVQWVFAALAYVFQALRIFKFAILLDYVDIYVDILLRVIKHDMPQFLLVFVVIVLAFGGGLHFALRGEESNGNGSSCFGSNSNSTDFNPLVNASLGINPSDTSEVHLTWLLGFRILAEGSVLDYTSYQWLAVIMYWLLIFIIAVILLNLLIAQFSKSYEKGIKHAEISIALTRLDICQKLETTWWRKGAQKLCVKPVQKILDATLKIWAFRENTEDSIFHVLQQANPDFVQTDDVEEGVRELKEDARELKAQQKSIQQELNEIRRAVGDIKNTMAEIKDRLPMKPQ